MIKCCTKLSEDLLEMLTCFYILKTPLVICTVPNDFALTRNLGFTLSRSCTTLWTPGWKRLYGAPPESRTNYHREPDPGCTVPPAGRNCHGAAGTTSAGVLRVTVTAGGRICWLPVAPPQMYFVIARMIYWEDHKFHGAGSILSQCGCSRAVSDSFNGC